MDLVMSPWEAGERVEYVQELVGKGDLDKLAQVLLFSSAEHEGVGVGAVLRAMPEGDREVLAQAFGEYVGTTRGVGDGRERGLVLLALVTRTSAAGAWCDAWNALLEKWAERYRYAQTMDELWVLSGALLDAGRSLSGEVVGLLRRSELEGFWDHVPTASILERLTEPVLNPGEPWADSVLAELPTLGAEWIVLVRHLLAVPGGAHTRAWDRRAAELADALGPERVRRTAEVWLERAAEGAGGSDGGYDRYNRPAIRGLALLLSLLPAHPRTVRVLGALVERPPAKATIAGSGVQALARLAGGAGRPELKRLAECVTHKVTLKQIRAALAV
ncbi:hypothetical protein OG742_16815 [Streptomyces sp. NBC_00828]|uniref:hypothetical protein n=1 Tax=Streptomyces sp. NBC_00828 TaxID=2903678 RepID=UPI003869A2F0